MSEKSQADPAGEWVRASVEGEDIRAFLPNPLPPSNLDIARLQKLLEKAALALGGLQQISPVLPDTPEFLHFCIRKEAVLSSQIEGTQSTLPELLLHERGLGDAPEDVTETSNYVRAMYHGIKRIGEDFPVCGRLIREIHEILLSSGRGNTKMPGQFRRSQNWIGGSRPGTAVYVPPPQDKVPDLMANLESFINDENLAMSDLVRAGIAHAQFESIHPFLDGNGRVGRVLITLLLCHAGVLRQPLLYLSLYFKQHRDTYYDLLNHVRRTGDWEAWLAFFLEGVQLTAEGAVSTAQRLSRMFQNDRNRIEQAGGRRAGSGLRVHDALKSQPILSLSAAHRSTNLSFQAAAAAMELLITHGIAREITGKRRGRLFVYEQYLSILNEGTEAEADR